VPQGAKRYSSLDEVLGHRCRYTRQNLSEELRATGFEVEVLRDFNRAGVPGWFLNGKLLRRRHFSRVQLKVFNVLVPLIRRLDRVFPWSGLGLIAVARRT
jgi:hypothetical protein